MTSSGDDAGSGDPYPDIGPRVGGRWIAVADPHAAWSADGAYFHLKAASRPGDLGSRVSKKAVAEHAARNAARRYDL